jgi:hypothetical protein
MTNIYIDENFAPQLARGFDIFQQHLNLKETHQLKVLSISDVFGRGSKDEDWIPQAGKENAIIITQDLKIFRTRHQNELFKKHGLGVFFFKPPSNGYSFWQMIEQLIKNWPEIKKKINTKKPFAFIVTPRGIKPL